MRNKTINTQIDFIAKSRIATYTNKNSIYVDKKSSKLHSYFYLKK